jgi:hypothetical protein
MAIATGIDLNKILKAILGLSSAPAASHAVEPSKASSYANTVVRTGGTAALSLESQISVSLVPERTQLIPSEAELERRLKALSDDLPTAELEKQKSAPVLA